MSEYFDLGPYSRHVTTTDPDAQQWFNRGLIWCYGFNHEEAVRCFQRVIELDVQCAMAHWGIAYASGPFYNKPWLWFTDAEREVVAPLCFESVQKAVSLSTGASPVERALIRALSKRYQSPIPVGEDIYDDWIDSYANEMRVVYAEFPEDPDVVTLCAEALMNRTPWRLWNIQSNQPAENADTMEVIQILESGLNRQKSSPVSHPGMLHFYIHALEMSPNPERALLAADALRNASPDNGHLLHMPTHIDILCGDYYEAIAANNRAIAADTRYIDLRGTSEFYMISCMHDFHLKMYAAMFMGQFESAMQAVDGIRSTLTEQVLRIDSPYLACSLEGYYSAKAHVLVRFGRWREIVDEPLPQDPLLYLVTTALLHYAKGIAHAVLGNIGDAGIHRQLFHASVEKIPEWHIVGNNPTRQILEIGKRMLEGELCYRCGKFDTGFNHLRKAVELADNLLFSEPWAWMHPPRHALGALLLEQNRVQEALEVYRADLGFDDTLPRCLQHPDNVWSLHGYIECLNRSNRSNEAEILGQTLTRVQARADVEINASCFCRLE